MQGAPRCPPSTAPCHAQQRRRPCRGLLGGWLANRRLREPASPRRQPSARRGGGGVGGGGGGGKRGGGGKACRSMALARLRAGAAAGQPAGGDMPAASIARCSVIRGACHGE